MQAGSANTTDLINKMKASIIHQAETTAQEITDQGSVEIDRYRVKMWNQARTTIENDTELETKRIKEQRSVKLSVVKGRQHMKMLKARDEAVNEAMKIAEGNLIEFAKKPEYTKLLHDLCLQGLMSLMEKEVSLAVTANDKDKLNGMLGQLSSDFKSKTNQDVALSVSDYVLPDAAIGGVVLIVKDGKIQCSNTLMDRLVLSCKELYPELRKIFLDEGKTEA